MSTVISTKRDFTPEQNLENPKDDFLNTEGKIISLILCRKIIDSRQASRQMFMRMKSLALIFALAGRRCINGIESFWSDANTRLTGLRGIRSDAFFSHLKETKWRFNHRQDNLYQTLLKNFASSRQI